MDINERLSEMLAEYGGKTVAELLEATTGTAGIALASMVAAKASIQMQTQVQADKYARIVRVPKGAGKTFTVQRLGAPDYDTWTEGSALAAADPTLGSVTGTLAQYGKVTKVTDLLQYTHVLDFVETVGSLHGNVCQAAINDKLWAEIKGATTNAVTLGTAADGAEATLTFDAVKSAIQKVQSSKWPGDAIVMGPKKFYEFVTQNVTAVQFEGALSDYFKSGRIPTVLGAEVVIDPLFGDTFTGADGEIYAAVFSKGISAAWGTDGKGPVTEIFRDPRELSQYVVTGQKLTKQEYVRVEVKKMLHPAYVAGLFDGEGSVYIEKQIPKPGSKAWKQGYRNPCYRLMITIVNSNRKILEMLKQQYGGSNCLLHTPSKLTKHKVFTWRLADNLALKFLEDIEPYVVIKKNQVNLGIQFQKHKKSHKCNRLTKQEIALREKFREKISFLNHNSLELLPH